MNILVIGSGAREHAIVWRLAQSKQVETIFVAPGNPGTDQENKARNIPITADNIAALKAFALEKKIDLTIVGPEAPLVAGIVDAFQKADLACFGPTHYCAQLEGSKSFAKAFLHKYHIPTAEYAVFEDLSAAVLHVNERALPMVIKADGLAAGKGVFIAHTRTEALTAVHHILSEHAFGNAGARIVVEDFLVGEEASFIVMVDGKTAIPFASSQDHKARDDGDIGPNTGGMGAYSPAPVVSPAIHDQIMKTIIQPTIEGMRAEGHPFTGFLYAGLMIDSVGNAKVLEFNCRLGDPEAQPLMMRLKSCLATLCVHSLAGTLDQVQCEWDPRPALCVVLASKGYPAEFPKGEIIEGLSPLSEHAEQKIFHGGTAYNPAGAIISAGGRVLSATALGTDLAEAKMRAYTLAKKIHWPNVYYRTDIGHRAL